MIAALNNRRPMLETPKPTTTVPAPQSPTACAIPEKPGHYFVEADNKQFAYKVTWDGTHGRCTCQAYTAGVKTNNAFQCSHIIAARKCPPPSTASIKGKTEAEIESILNRPFQADKIQTKRDGTKYIETTDIIERLNDAFGNTGWSFSHKEPIEMDDTREIVCSGKIEAHVGDRLVFKEHSGTCRYDTESNDGETISYGDARKEAIQMALKNCAFLFGVGLKQLHTKEQVRPAGFTNSYQSPTGFSNNHQPPRNINTQGEIPF